MSHAVDQLPAEGTDAGVLAYATESNPGTIGESDPMPPATIRRNMSCCIMMDAIWGMGWANVSMALSPLMIFLGASNTLIGLVTGAMFFCIPGVLVSPIISRHFPYKKWYFLTANIPYLLPLALAGVAVLMADNLSWSNATLLTVFAGAMVAHWFFGGFVALPHTEYIVACIPSTHRGRLTGLSYTVDAVLGLISTSIGGYILLKLAKPESFGWLFIIAWLIMQSGYIAALFATERRTPVEKSPPAWSKEMLRAFWNDRNFVKFTISQMLLTVFLGTPVWQFINVYGFRDLKMIPATSAVMLLVSQVVRITCSAPLGMLTDRIGPKRLYPLWMLAAATIYWPAILLQNAIGVYISIALSAIYLAGISTSGSVLSQSLPKPENRSGHFTILVVFGMMTMALGPILIGALADMFSYRTIFMTISGVSVGLYFVLKHLCKTFPESFRETA